MPKELTEAQKRRNAKVIADAKKAWGGTKKAAAKVAKGVDNVTDITWDTLKGSTKEVTSGDFGLRMGRHATKAAKSVAREGGDIFRVVSEQAKKYLADAIRIGKAKSRELDAAVPPHLRTGDVAAPRPNAIKERFEEEEEMGIVRGGKRKKKAQ